MDLKKEYKYYCIEPGCDSLQQKGGYCRRHTQTEKNVYLCSVEDCDKQSQRKCPFTKQNMCYKHLKQHERHYNPTSALSISWEKHTLLFI